MPAIDITDKVKAIQYTGSNSAEIDSLITDFTIVSETGGVLTFTSSGGNFIAATSDYIKYTQGFVLNTYTPSFFDFAFIRNAVYSDLTAITTAVTTLQSQVAALMGAAGVKSAGTKELPLLSPGLAVHTVPLTVTLPTTAGYTPQSQLFAAAGILGSLVITATSLASTSTVNVTVNNTSLLGISGARLFVTVT